MTPPDDLPRLPNRRRDTSKRDYGRVVVVGGAVLGVVGNAILGTLKLGFMLVTAEDGEAADDVFDCGVLLGG